MTHSFPTRRSSDLQVVGPVHVEERVDRLHRPVGDGHPVVRREGVDLAHAAIHEPVAQRRPQRQRPRSEEHTSELQSLMRISYAVFCLKQKKEQYDTTTRETIHLSEFNISKT